MKKAGVLFGAVLLCIGLMVPVLAAPPEKPAENGYVHDYAGVLTAETRQAIEVNGARLSASGPSALLFTADFLDGMNSEEYAL